VRLSQLEHELSTSGYVFCRQTGSHRIYRSIDSGRSILVVNPSCGHRHGRLDRYQIAGIRQGAQQRQATNREVS
jgi:predicted RNA binding protein YcfA (HicA-like mRNA interferase family)